MTLHAKEVRNRERFEFGDNWLKYLAVLDESRVNDAKLSLETMLDVDTLDGKTFLDIGSGSGIMSLVARKSGAKVHSFDYDPESVTCTHTVKQRYYPNDDNWNIEHGSILDADYVSGLGQFDIVYSWGVLHHTGNMWKALDNVSALVKPNGILFIAIYNDQGNTSIRWKYLKKLYNKYSLLHIPLIIYTLFRQWSLTILRDTLHGKPLLSWRNYKITRGMSPWHDIVDWIGGYPFEYAKPEQILSYYLQRGFNITQLKTCGGGIGCNEYVFKKIK